MPHPASDALERARRIRLMILDVDGVLTDGTLWYGARGIEELKGFHSVDGLGLQMLRHSGVHAAILSGRTSSGVAARALELGIEHVLQGIGDKLAAYRSLIERLGLTPEQTGYMGDDLVDIPVLARCGVACGAGESAEGVRRRAHYHSAARAGRGPVREVRAFSIRALGTMDRALQEYLDCG